MRIAVLAHNLRFAGGHSVGVNVIAALARVADEHDYLLFCPQGLGYEGVPKPSRADCRYVPHRCGSLGPLWFERFVLPREVEQFHPDLVWGLGNFGLTRPPCAQAVLFHKPQLVYEAKYRRETWKKRLTNWAVRRRLVRSLPATQLVFCQTSVAAERFPRYLPYSGRIAIMPNAVSEFTKAGDAGQRPPVFRQLVGKFVLFCLTHYYGHKNLESLVDVFRRYPQELRDTAVILTIAPDQGRRARTLLNRIERYALHEHLVAIGPVPQADLPGYFKSSQALILPTLLESFTATYLEAMQYDCPILTSDLDFARVVCDDAALYFDPFSSESIRAGILKLQHSPEVRAELIARGAQRRRAFVRDWDSIVSEAVREMSALVAPAPRAPASR